MYTTGFLFNGGCGDMRGFANAGFDPRFGANHDAASVATARLNWPNIYVREAAIQTIDMRTLPYADVLGGSPICWESAPAGGNSQVRVQVELSADSTDNDESACWEQTRITAWEPVRYTEVHKPLVYAGENVPRFATGNRPLFNAWLHVWDALGYYPEFTSVNSAHITVETPDGVLGPLPQYRDRLVWVMVRKDIGKVPDLRPRPQSICRECGPVKGVQFWPGHTSGRGRRIGSYLHRMARSGTSRAKTSYYYVCPTERCHQRVEPVTRGIGSVINKSVRGHRFGDGRQDRNEAYGKATRARVAAGIATYSGQPFIVTLRNHCTASSLDDPIGTITAQGGAHHYFVRPTESLLVDDCEYRSLTVEENASAQGFPERHRFAGKPSEIKSQVGNAVPVTVATWAALETMKIMPP
ncbi:DNA cytosine methyltransferase [Streptomyces sp. NPDC057438]|uniref:DNA cytosine methyltransferase n=1 Tax=Streptomyces sp. NPDC057438 TaxID=3346133 RepID=UPI0036CD8559